MQAIEASPQPIRRFFPVIPLIIILNLVVYFFWAISAKDESSFMYQNFLVSWDSLTQGRIWTLLTSVFSHNMFWHFLVNMMVLNSFGPILQQILGTKFFVKFYLAAGVISSLSHALVSMFILGAPELPALGASGAIAGLVLLFSLLLPRERILIFGLIPVPALFGALAFIGLDLWGLLAQVHGGGLPIGHGAHLGGAFTGVIVYFWILRPRLKSRFRRI